MKNPFTNKWSLRLVALFFAIVLFVYASSSKVGSTRDISQRGKIIQLTSTKSATVSVPLSLNVNSNKFFVTGYPEKVLVHLKGPAALVTTTANTQNFKAYADLSHLGVGEHTIKIQQDGINNELRYSFEPAKIRVDIQPRKTVSYPLQANYAKSNIAPGYQAGDASTDIKSVKVTGATSEINQVKKVVAQLNVPQNAKSTIESQAVIEALDADGKTVNVVITPATTNVKLPIAAGRSKEVGLKLTAKGETGSSDQVKLSTDTKRVRIFGTKAQLADISSAEVRVDISDVTGTKTKKVTLDSKLNDVQGFEPNSIKVKIVKSTKS